MLLAGALVFSGCGKKEPVNTSTSSVETETSVSETKEKQGKTSVASASQSVEEKEPEEEPEKCLETVAFGTYEQDNNPENGPEPIEWTVIFEDNEGKLLISNKILDCVQFNKKFESCTWENSSIRKFLNGDFYNSAFSAEEQGKIVAYKATSVDPKVYIEEQRAQILADLAASGSASGNEQPKIDESTIDIPGTEDKVFLLSDYEVKQYLPDDPEVKGDESFAYVTPYAEANGVYTLTKEEYDLFKLKDKHSDDIVGAGWWWLRSTGTTEAKAMDVASTGEIRVNGHDTGESHDGIRPVIYIRK